MTEEQTKEFLEASKPLMKFLCDNMSEGATVFVTQTCVQLSEETFIDHSYEFLKD